MFYSTAFKEGFKPSAEKLFFVVRNHFPWEANTSVNAMMTSREVTSCEMYASG